MNAGTHSEALPPLPWLVYRGDFTVAIEDWSGTGSGDIWFDLASSPRLFYDVSGTCENKESADQLRRTRRKAVEVVTPIRSAVPILELQSFSDEEEVPQTLSSNRSGRGNPWRQCGPVAPSSWTEAMSAGDGSALDSVQFLLVNFSADGNWQPEMTVGPWSLELRQIAEPPQLTDYAVTHLLQARRTDGTYFDSDDVANLGQFLHECLLFVTGRRVGLAMPRGFLGGAPVWMGWGSQKTDAWSHNLPWWDSGTGDLANLELFMNQWWQLALDSERAVAVKRAMYCYADAASPKSIDGAVPIAAMGLEIMCWELLVRRSELMDPDEFDKTRFGTRLRLALRLSGIDFSLPEQCSALRHFARGETILDGPSALVNARNRVIHPPKKKNQTWPDSKVLADSWLLSLEYLALLILAAVDYDGAYVSQWTRQEFEAERPVPWAAHPVNGHEASS